jgi:hypothetical protein
MVLTLDALRRPIIKETRLVTRPDSSGKSLQVVSREFTDYDRTGRSTREVSSIFINDTLTAVRSQGFSFAQGRISATDTRVAEVTNGPVSTGFQRGNADDYLSSPKYTENERFTYDGNGNVVADDQYSYAYDHHGRLSSATRLFADTDPLTETGSYGYDTFGRLRFFSNNLRNADRTFIYDGNNAIAEYRTVGGNPVLLARYVHGAGEGEIVRMDRRQDDDPTKPLKTYYIHEGLTGGYNFALSDGFRDPQIISRERSLGFSENLIEGTKTRFPYVSRNARYDPFTEFVYDEIRHIYTYNYTRAPIIAWRERQEQWLAMVRERTSEMQAKQLTIMAIPLLPLAPMMPVAAWVGGGLSVGLDYAMTSYVGGEYSFRQGMKAFGLGAVGGSFGAALGALPGVSGAARLGIEVGFDVATGALIDVASGGNLTESLLHNVLLSAVGGVGGKVQAAAASRYAKAPILGANLLKPFSSGMRAVIRVAIENSDSGKPAKSSRPRKIGDAETPPTQRALIRKTIVNKLLKSENLIDWIIGSYIEAGALQLKLRPFLDRPGARGRIFSGNTKTIYLNERYFLDEYDTLLTSPSAMTDMTSTVVHEGVHFLGGGEIVAHLAQGLFLNLALKKNPKLQMHPTSHELAGLAVMDSLVPLTKRVIARGYGPDWKPLSIAHLRPLNDLVKELDGFASIIGVKETHIRKLKQAVPQAFPL